MNECTEPDYHNNYYSLLMVHFTQKWRSQFQRPKKKTRFFPEHTLQIRFICPRKTSLGITTDLITT